MRKISALFLLLAVLLSCQKNVRDTLPRYMRMQDRFARYARKDTSEAKPPRDSVLKPVPLPDVYATALCFPDSVDWRADSLGPAQVLLFKNGVLSGRYPVEGRPEADRHRFRGGHLWTDFTDGSHTAILCDGKERFRYEGEELLRGFLLEGGRVHTLGQRPGSGGLCYRIDGEAVFEAPRGTVLGSSQDAEWEGGALARDGQDICFSYSLPLGGGRREYRVMRAAETLQVLQAGPSDAIFDLRVRGGTLFQAREQDGKLYLLKGEERIPVVISAPATVLHKLVPRETTVTLRGSTASGILFYNWFLDPALGNVRSLGMCSSAQSQAALGGNTWAVADVNPAGVVQSLSLGQTQVASFQEEDYTLRTPRCLFLSYDGYALALTAVSGNEHLLKWARGEYSLSFNGYFTSVRIE